MTVLGGVAASVGIVLFHAALSVTLRANPDTRIPLYRNPEIIPAGSVVMRAAGAGLIVLGAVLLTASTWYWPCVVIAAGPVAALAIITFHNSKLANRKAEHSTEAR